MLKPEIRRPPDAALGAFGERNTEGAVHSSLHLLVRHSEYQRADVRERRERPAQSLFIGQNRPDVG
ncbi:hypothetical protein ACFWD1_05230 [Micromonospora chalcea]